MSFLEQIKEVKKKNLSNLTQFLTFNNETIINRKLLSHTIKRKDEITIIAEIKRASPSTGFLHNNLKVSEMAKAYEAGGASAISVITETEYFHGSYADLLETKLCTSLPVLAKDFIIHPDQIMLSYYSGADAVLLILKLLDDAHYHLLFNTALQYGLEVVAEVNTREEIERACALPVTIIGVNRRNLETLIIDKKKTEELIRFLPPDAVKIAESGIDNASEIRELKELGYDCCLIGSSIVKSADPASFIKHFLLQEN